MNSEIQAPGMYYLYYREVSDFFLPFVLISEEIMVEKTKIPYFYCKNLKVPILTAQDLL